MKQPMQPDEEAAILAAIRKGHLLLLVVPPEMIIKGLQQWSTGSGDGVSSVSEVKTTAKRDLYSCFEQEFGRPLSPLEIEKIHSWLEDRHSEELILTALKEAVFASKVHFRYVDTTLLDWKRNQIVTVEQAKEHAKKFRGRKD